MARLNAISFPFGIDSASGRTRGTAEYDAYIRQLIRQVLLTNQGERINRPNFGANIKAMVFAPNNPATASYGRSLVYQALSRWLADFIKVEDVQLEAVESTLTITVSYAVIATGEKRFLNMEVGR